MRGAVDTTTSDAGLTTDSGVMTARVDDTVTTGCAADGRRGSIFNVDTMREVAAWVADPTARPLPVTKGDNLTEPEGCAALSHPSSNWRAVEKRNEPALVSMALAPPGRQGSAPEVGSPIA